VVVVRTVEDGLDVLGLEAAVAELRNGAGAVGFEPRAVGRIRPGLGDDAGAVHGAEVVLERSHQRVDGVVRGDVLLDQQGFQRADPRLDVGRWNPRVVVVRVMVMGHRVSPASAWCRVQATGSR
jgi:hypothetical protein